MEHILEDIIMLVFVHFMSTFLFFYVATKLFVINLPAKKLTLITVFYSLFSYAIRKTLIFMELPVGFFIPLNLILMVLTLIIGTKMPWRYATIGTLISFAAIVLWSPITFLIANQLGWGYPNNSIVINLLCGYLEIFGLILLATYLKLTKANLFKVIPLDKNNSRIE